MIIPDMMIILTLFIVLYYCLTKTYDLTFIRCHNIRLQSCPMVVRTSVSEPSWHDDVCVCTLTFLYHIHYVNSDLRRYFFNDGYDIFMSLDCAKSYPRTMSAYNLCIYFPFFFVSPLWRYFLHNFPLSSCCILSYLLMI